MGKSDKKPSRGSYAIGGAPYQRLLEVAEEINLTPNEIVTGLVRDCLVALDSPDKSSAGDIAFLLALRRKLHRDLSGRDKLALDWLAENFPGWDKTTPEYRRLLLKAADETDDLDARVIKKLADKAMVAKP
jgi:hypothetical protein